MHSRPGDLLERLTAAGSMPEVRRRFADFLGLDEPLPDQVVHRALADPPFLHNLIVSRGAPPFLRTLLGDPKNRDFRRPPSSLASSLAALDAAEEGDKAAAAESVGDTVPGSFRLAARAAVALARWGAAGIGRVEPELLEQRWAACLACPHLIEPPKRAVYRLAGGGEPDRRVCAACGCVARRKAKLPTERCPRADPARPGFNRWGQSLS